MMAGACEESMNATSISRECRAMPAAESAKEKAVVRPVTNDRLSLPGVKRVAVLRQANGCAVLLNADFSAIAIQGADLG
jgi:hypothetical protein